MVHGVHILGIDGFQRGHHAAGQQLVHGQVGAPHLRKLEVRRGDGQVIARVGRRVLRPVLVHVGAEGEADRGGRRRVAVVAVEGAEQHAVVGRLVANPHERHAAGEDARTAAQLGFLVVNTSRLKPPAARTTLLFWVPGWC